MNPSRFKALAMWIMLSVLPLIAACANGGYYPPYYERPYYTPSEYLSPTYPYLESDPQFWQMWQDRHGGG